MAAPRILCRRGGGAALGLCSRSPPPPIAAAPYSARCVSQLVQSNGKRAFLVDTLALVRRLEAQGLPSKQAEVITSVITEVLNDSLENVAQSFVSKGDMQKSEVTQDSDLSKFKSEVQSSQLCSTSHNVLCSIIISLAGRSFILYVIWIIKLNVSWMQEHHFGLLQQETEKLRGDIEKMRSELRYEIDKVTAGQRLDLNLERGRIRDELAKQGAETTQLTTKLDREIHAFRAQLEAAKLDIIKYCVGTLVSVAAVGIAVLRNWM